MSKNETQGEHKIHTVWYSHQKQMSAIKYQQERKKKDKRVLSA
jgi:hypothetical protein